MMNACPNDFKELCESVKRIEKDSCDTKLAVCGNERLGVPGLLKRVDRLENKDRRRELRFAALSGIFIVGYEGIRNWLDKGR